MKRSRKPHKCPNCGAETADEVGVAVFTFDDWRVVIQFRCTLCEYIWIEEYRHCAEMRELHKEWLRRRELERKNSKLQRRIGKQEASEERCKELEKENQKLKKELGEKQGLLDKYLPDSYYTNL